jgi:PAS domain S-box-containing protein/putative nucleotidyltransferase with HDIG domain
MSIAITRLRDNVLVDVNETWVNLTGYTREEVIAHPVTDLGLWIVSSQRVELIERLRAEGDVQGFEFQMRKKSGEVSDLLFAAVPIEVAGEACMLSMALDITERKHMEQALHESEERFRSLYNNATIGLYRTTPEGRILMCNPAAVRMLGFDSFDDLVKRNLEEEGFEPDYPRQEFRERMERDGMVIGLESKWFKKDGTSIFVRESATAVRDTQGKIVHYDGTFEDITEWKRAEEALRASEKKFKTLFEIAPVGISVLDQDMNILDANYALQRITGLKKKKLLNGSHRKRTYLRPDETAMPPEEFASSRAFQENMPIFDVETGIVTEDRGVVWTLVSAAPLDMPDASLVVITQDISDRKQTERAMRHRLAELETLYESGLSLNQLLEPREIGQKIIDVLSEKLDWNHTTVRLYHPESDELELLAYNIAGKTTKKEWKEIGERFKTLIARSGDGLSGWALKHGETVRCGDVLQDPRYKETVPGLRSGLYAPIMTGGRAIGVISVESEKPDYFTPEDEHLAVTLAAQAAVAFENIRLFKDLQASNDGLLRAYDKTIEGWSHALDLRDKETEGHTQRVTALTEDLARAMGIPEPDLIYIRWGALMHDIGKMGVPDRILLKPDKLSDDEWVIMRQHPVHAYNLISQIDFLKPALNIPHHHHERWDGSGYPEGLQGEQIPLEARIFAVIDVFDALTSDRPYRPAWPKDKAIQHIHEGSGKHFDPQVVDVFLNLIR